jgi:hypothetical protein
MHRQDGDTGPLQRGEPSAYRYQHFSLPVLLEDMRFAVRAPTPGEAFPDFDLPTTDGRRLRKADFVGRRPMFMVAASYT